MGAAEVGYCEKNGEIDQTSVLSVKNVLISSFFSRARNVQVADVQVAYRSDDQRVGF